jgi:glycosyltransferase involved in cell wall biosynthesis
MRYFFRNTVEKSNLCFAIGDLMCETYTSYFGKPFFPIMNSVTIEEYESKNDNKNGIIVNYFGSIHTNRWQMILKLAKILEKFDKKNIVLNVYTENEPDRKILKLFSEGGVNFKGGVFGKNLRKTILESDILLHVESDDRNSVSLTKLSISTKIPEYLISGRPILGFGPRDIASMRYLTDNRIGIVISPSDESTDISNQLEKLFTDTNFRVELGKFAYEFAVKNFDNNKIVSDFNLKIEQVLNAGTVLN